MERTRSIEIPGTSSLLLAVGFNDLPQPGVPADIRRHNQKVKQAIRGDLGAIIGSEDIITSDGKKIVKIPVKTVNLPRIVFDPGHEGVGQGEGGTQEGKVIGQKPGQGQQGKAGESPGTDYYDAEVSVDELAEMVFADLGLPNLEDRGTRDIVSEDVRFNDVRKKGSVLDRRRTILTNLQRRAQAGEPTVEEFEDGDLRFKTWETEVKPEKQAAVIAMRDVSGSMGEFEKYITRAFYFWMVRFLRTKYRTVDIRFITHHTEAKEVNEADFFGLGESGGTLVSPAYQLCLDMTNRDYPSSDWNVYPFHLSDGDNWGEIDNGRCVDLIKAGLPFYNMFGYGEIRNTTYRRMIGDPSSTLMKAMEALKDEPKVVSAVMASKEDVYPALKTFFPGEGKLK